MSKSKITPEEKLDAIQMINSGNESMRHVAERLNVALLLFMQKPDLCISFI